MKEILAQLSARLKEVKSNSRFIDEEAESVVAICTRGTTIPKKVAEEEGPVHHASSYRVSPGDRTYK